MEFPIPEAQYWDVTKKSEKERAIVRKFLPEAVPLKICRPSEIYEIDTFFLESQKFRDYYRDPYGRVHLPKMFSHHRGTCGIKLDHTLALMMESVKANVDSLPLIYPLLPDNTMGLGKGFRMGACNSFISSSNYKR
ncbi:hypothetical protein KR018_003938 [Drosophila ironensis]|nr:hypothetical protein KR018_003938 [Drosophila ironensis]